VVAVCPNDETVRILDAATWEEKAKLAGVRSLSSFYVLSRCCAAVRPGGAWSLLTVGLMPRVLRSTTKS
jgi:hypothetical protein